MPLQLKHSCQLPALAFLVVTSVNIQAQGYEPVMENFRLGASDQLTIDRGGPVDRAGDVNGDNLQDLLVGAGVGAVRVIFGPTNGFNGVLNGQQLDGNSGFVILNDPVNDSLVAGLGDVNGDGLDDVGVASVTGTRVIFGSSAGFSRTLDVASLNGSNGFVIETGATDLKRAGDVNGDGLDDFIVGNANASPNALTGAGASYVIFGRTTAFPASLSLASIDGNTGFGIVGISAQDRTGFYVSGAGDFNNDGFDDVLIGAPYQTTDAKAEAGAAYLVLGGNDFPTALSLADIDGTNGFVFKGSDIQNHAGASVAAIGDINHDGADDLAIGAPGKGPFGVPNDYPGETYVLFGGSFAGVASVAESDLDGTNGFVARGIRGGVVPIEVDQAIWGDMAGADVDSAGDINGDGINDMMIGAPHTIINPSRKGVGQVYFVYGSNSAFPSRLSLADLDGSNGFRIDGTGTVDYYAVSVAGAGDFNDDDRDDVMIGASGQGESYVFYGRDTGAQNVGSAPIAGVGSTSTGFPAAALSLGVDAQPLVFSELADPTGPSPLPPGTPTDPLDPATPGFTAPIALNTSPPARPVAGEMIESMPDDIGNVPPDTPGESVGGPDEGSETGEETVAPNDQEAAGDGVVRTAVGSVLWLPMLLLAYGFARARCCQLWGFFRRASFAFDHRVRACVFNPRNRAQADRFRSIQAGS